jgi:serine O-acetyltransferase
MLYRTQGMARTCLGMARRPGISPSLHHALVSSLPSVAAWLARADPCTGALGIPWSLNAGPGLKLLYGLGIVINAETSIGSNVTIMQGVTIGRTQRGIPVIENDVIVCANATVLGGIRLGHGSIVGAGAVVTKDVPANSNVAGNPARVMPRTMQPRHYHPLPMEMR